jgi:uncharacterized protein
VIIAAARSSFASQEWRKRLTWPSDKPFRILSIDGGGIRGIFPAAVLSKLESRYAAEESIGRYFDLITGTSTGGILALALSIGKTAREVLELYERDGKKIFPPGTLTRYWRAVRSSALYRCDHTALRNALVGTLGARRLAEAHCRLCVPSFEGHHGEVYIFKTPHHPDYRIDAHSEMVTVGQATSAAPTYFRAVDSGGYRYVDGGIWANDPVMIGLVDALACYSLDSRQIRILSLGCGNDPVLVGKLKAIGGLIAWRDAIFAAMNLQSQNAQGQAGLLVGPRNLVRVEPRLSKPIGLDDWSRSIAELPSAAHAAVEASGADIFRLFLGEASSRAEFYWPPSP